ncbi:MAG: DMT family transporter [SAR324 cluster bacterium]|nr:DMT family transporter [SAR324 cluster bacterium]MBL7035694.1 DMT family transporter [SAR324 cluster bacterium]
MLHKISNQATSITLGRTYILFAGLLWSTGGPLIRLLDNASEWQYLFYRSIALSVSLFFLINKKSFSTISQFKKSGIASLIGGLFLSFAFVSFVFSITHSTIANTLFMMSSAPFIAGFLGWILLKEQISKTQWTAMMIAFVGIVVMIQEGTSGDSFFGSLAAFITALGFACFTVSLRWGKNKNMLPAVFYAGLITVVFCAAAILYEDEVLVISLHDLLIALGFGAFGLGFGLVLFVAGSYQIQSAELILLSLIEVILGPVWAWMFFKEYPTQLTLIGGAILLSAILFKTIAGMNTELKSTRV